jgi:hypothetical protein
MNVWGGGSWDSAGRLSISGAFEPSTEYTIASRSSRTTSATPWRRWTSEGDDRADGRERVDAGGRADPRRAGLARVHGHDPQRRPRPLLAWLVQDDAEALNKARNQVEQHETRARGRDRDPVQPGGEAERVRQDLRSTCSRSLSPGKNYILSLVLDDPAFDAKPVKYPSWMSASRSPLTLVTPGDEQALAVHTHVTPEATLVHVARLATGEPVPGASVLAQRQGPRRPQHRRERLRGAAGRHRPGRRRPADGQGRRDDAAGAAQAGQPRRAAVPASAAESAPALGDRRALVITDRGIYRPGSKVFIKASVRRKLGEQIVPLAATPVRVRVLGPTDDELADLALVTDDMGSVAGEYEIPAEARVGRHRIEVAEASDDGEGPRRGVIQVAEFEPPRFTVDVDASLAASNTLRAKVLGKYLFGAAMDKAAVEWTLTARTPAPGRPVHRRRLPLLRRPLQLVGRGRGGGRGWSRAGEGELGPDGTLAVTQKLDLGDAVGPQEFTFEADVADSSYRHIAGRGSVVVHPTPRYVGVKIDPPVGRRRRRGARCSSASSTRRASRSRLPPSPPASSSSTGPTAASPASAAATTCSGSAPSRRSAAAPPPARARPSAAT